jgi:hypothetical protein
MKSVAIEIIKRKLVVSWWANVRFEKSFTRDLCLLLKAAGCIAVSGGLEVASDRLLDLIDKGITVAQVAKVSKHFSDAGIMVHAYLMYGFPTQSVQETVDSLEMVRQLFETGTLQSAFWHLFTMTAHSPVGLNPEKYKVKKLNEAIGTFANNDIEHIDPTGANHEIFGFGLKKALLNYMHGACFELPLQKWFDFKVPATTVPSNFILNAIQEPEYIIGQNHKIIWTGNMPTATIEQRSKKGNKWEEMNMHFQTNKTQLSISVSPEVGKWFLNLLPLLSIEKGNGLAYAQVKESYINEGLQGFELCWDNKPFTQLYKAGLFSI